MAVARVAALVYAAIYLVAALLPCGGFGPTPHAVGEHAHASSAATQRPAMPQLDVPCPCGCDEDDAAHVSGVRLGLVKPALAAGPDSAPDLRAWLAPGPQLPAEPALGIDPVPI
jgi:hypothetical protein